VTSDQPPRGAGTSSADGLEERPTAKPSLLDAVVALRRDVARTAFPLPLEGVERAETRRGQLLDQLDDHLLPRLQELSAPAVVVVAGSTGAGKSTLVNSVLGREVSPAGVLRPTTRRPVLVHHPADADLLAAHPLLAIVDVVVDDAVPRGIALVDAPDLDSLLASNRTTAHRLLEAADLWIFVTTAARYGDALPWDVLGSATERKTSMAMVLNRVPPDALVTVRTELMARLRERGMAAVPLFLVPDAGPHHGLLEARSVAPILRWLTMVAGPDRARSVIARTQRGALAALRPWVDELAEAVQAQVDAAAELRALVSRAEAGPAEAAEESVRAGAVVVGPVRAVWSSLVGAGGPLRGRLTSRRGRDARHAAVPQLLEEVRTSAEVVLTVARKAAHAALVEALSTTQAPGAGGLLAALTDGSAQKDGRGPVPPDESSSQWVALARDLVGSLAGAPDKQRARGGSRLVRAVGTEGATAVAAAAAAGLGPARGVLASLVGEDVSREITETLTDDLARRATEQASAPAAEARLVLESDDLADDAASLLRLRLAVLKSLT
jgi:energy-coupling factor transporter ATP-binding protein EcfA2